jgi:hypothetical protein
VPITATARVRAAKRLANGLGVGHHADLLHVKTARGP